MPLGTDTVMLTVTDSTGATASATVVDKIIDTKPPEVTADLDRQRKHHRDGDGHDDGDDHEHKDDLFKVVFNCHDVCSRTTTSMANINGIPVTNGEIVELERSRKAGEDRDDGILLATWLEEAEDDLE
jgi:hypothetical protein